MLLTPEKTLFVRGATPALLLADADADAGADAAFRDALPTVTAPDGAVPLCEGWSIVPKLTLCVVDGPGEAGGLIPALVAPVIDVSGGSAEPGDMADWCEDVERAGGAVVLSLGSGELPAVLDWAHLLGSGTARGGFMPILT
ncbi:hypothetical protein IPZ58_31170 [Streptomyces roseoverticillatus]|uniref:hypothetical protein n=1 Tax=Streptomyces roseoverticillatus TaxID=66429 RepID=UPI001F1B3535|nr:hypothetical protein [Streptomyces roseoverticillatus]MCF3106001.1 hypothetical protein [Streptomyces roseoverticillatus]